MPARLVLILGSGALIIVSWLLFYIERNETCLFAQTIDSVTWHENGQTQSIPMCERQQEQDRWTLTKEDGERLQRAFTQYESFLISLQPKGVPKLALEVFSDRQRFWRREPYQIAMSADVLRQPSILLRSLVEAWLLDQGDASLAADAVLHEALADVLTSVAEGGLRLRLPGAEQSVSLTAQPTLVESLFSIAHLCHSSWYPLAFLPLCQSLQENHHLQEQGLEFTPYSARPLLAQALWQIYLALPLSERLKAMKHFAQVLPAYRWGDQRIHQPEEMALYISRRVNEIMRQWQQSEESAKNHLQGRGLWAEAMVRPVLRWGVLGLQNLAQARLLVQQSGKKSPIGLAYVVGESVVLAPHSFALKDVLPEHLAFHHLLWVSCQKPSMSELARWAKNVHRLVLVRWCKEVNQLPLHLLLEESTLPLVRALAEAPLLQINLRFWPEAQAQRHPLAALVQAMWDDRRDKNPQTVWPAATIKWIPEAKAYRVLTPIETVQWVRL